MSHPSLTFMSLMPHSHDMRNNGTSPNNRKKKLVRASLNKLQVRDLTPVSKGDKRCTSQHARITIVELVHRQLSALILILMF